jgi:hypothetical protein
MKARIPHLLKYLLSIAQELFGVFLSNETKKGRSLENLFNIIRRDMMFPGEAVNDISQPDNSSHPHLYHLVFAMIINANIKKKANSQNKFVQFAGSGGGPSGMYAL